MVKTIIEKGKSGNGVVGFYKDGDLIKFDYRCLFDSDNDEWICASGKFLAKEYKKAINFLKKKGSCLIVGIDCQIKIAKEKEGGLNICFLGSGLDNSISIMGIDWTAEQLKI